MSDKPAANLGPAMYVHRVHEVQTVANSCGYAIAIHGSMQRDLDVVAVPWVDEALPQEELIRRLCEWFGLEKAKSEEKPHGRTAYTLLMWGGLFVDLSVMPRKESTP